MESTDTLNSSISAAEFKNEIDPDPIVRKLRADAKKLRSKVDELKLQLGEQEDFFGQIVEHLDIIDAPEIEYVPNTDTDKTCSAVLQVSDWHIGADIEQDEIEGFNSFNLEIATKRAGFLIERFLEKVEGKRHTHNIDECVIICNGDMISGDIHDELRVTNEFPIPLQCTNAAALFSEFVATISPHFETVRVEFLVPDNHSRRTKKNQMKQAGVNSYNYLVGYMAQLKLAEIDNINFHLEVPIKKVIQIQNVKYLVEHGHTIQGWAGFPWYGAERETSREAKSRMFTEHQFHKMIIGHFHVPMNTEFFMVNGSLSGCSEYDHANGRNAKPAQITWFVDSEYGETDWNAFELHYADDR